VALAALTVILSKALTLLLPFFYKGVVDGMAIRSPLSIIMLTIAAYGLARFGSFLFDAVRTPIFEIVAQEAIAALTSDAFDNIHRLDPAFHAHRKSGPLLKILERGTRGLDSLLFFLLFNIVPTTLELAVIAVIIAYTFGAPMLAGAMLLIALYIAFTKYVTDRRTAVRRDMLERDLDAADVAMESLINHETIRQFGAEPAESARYRAARTAYARAKARNESTVSLLNIGQAAITSFAIAAAMAVAVLGWQRGGLTPGDVVLVNTLLFQAFAPLDMLGAVYREIRQGLVDLEQLFDLLDQRATLRDGTQRLPPDAQGYSIAFDDVTFGYDPERPVLKHISFRVEPGETVAIVGRSGSGKSSIIKLVYRFYDADTGHVRVAGHDVRTLSRASLRAGLAIVPQDAVLFNRTIADNIALGDPDADASRIHQAALAAGLTGLIETLPEGYDTIVGERGIRLSGGERQRVAIARALLKQAPILILDEATSALDGLSEAVVQRSLAARRATLTTLVIAHRLSTIRDADRILVLDDGVVVEAGTHDALIGTGGLYARNWARQQRRDEADDDAIWESHRDEGGCAPGGD
jgi:ATP-binding cassette subfamily B protein